MNVQGRHYRTLWVAADGWSVEVIDQRALPHAFEIVRLQSVEEVAHAIRSMMVRGAPLIGATAAYGVCLAVRADPGDENLAHAVELLARQRPTAVNLRWALDEMVAALRPLPAERREEAAYARAAAISDDDVETCRRIGQHGLGLLREIAARKGGEPVHVLTHCNAGWLATVDWGTATSPIYQAFDEGIAVHVWVDETRPRNQGASLTAFELGAHRVPHTLIADNAGGHLMQQGMVDICLVGTDRTAANGDVANKIGTYLKALAARDNDVPFYVALPYSTIDWSIADGAEIPIEERSQDEVLKIAGRAQSGEIVTVDLAAPGTAAANHGFDVTPARLVTGLITERGICEASLRGLLELYPERARDSTS